MANLQMLYASKPYLVMLGILYFVSFSLMVHGLDNIFRLFDPFIYLYSASGHLVQTILPLSFSGKLKFTVVVNLPGLGGGDQWQVSQTHIELDTPVYCLYSYNIRTGRINFWSWNTYDFTFFPCCNQLRRFKDVGLTKVTSRFTRLWFQAFDGVLLRRIVEATCFHLLNILEFDLLGICMGLRNGQWRPMKFAAKPYPQVSDSYDIGSAEWPNFII